MATNSVNLDNKAQSLIIVFNIISSLSIAMFFSYYPRLFEVPSHYMEYTINILVSLVNLLFVLNYFKRSNTGFSSFSLYTKFNFLEKSGIYKKVENFELPKSLQFFTIPLNVLKDYRWVELILTIPIIIFAVLIIVVYSGI
jgi:hypothetical protein